MGVLGLWSLLHPLARPITLESLEGQTLAVDTSVWLHQALKSGNEVPNAHLVVLFHRICKLILFRIKPVFVFDGKPPALKLDTLEKRRKYRQKAGESAEKAREQLLQNYIKKKAVTSVYKKGSTGENEDDSSLFKISSALTPDVDSEFVQDDNGDGWIDSGVGDLNFADADLDGIDIAGKDFMSLPLEIQHEVLVEMLERGRRSRFAPSDVAALAQSSVDFSELQFSRLKRRGEINHRLDAVRKSMAQRDTADSVADMVKGQAVEEILSRRIVSQDEGHTVLLKSRIVRKSRSGASQVEVDASQPSTSTVEEKQELDVRRDQTSVHNDEVKSEDWVEQPEDDRDISSIDWASIEAMRAKLKITTKTEDVKQQTSHENDFDVAQTVDEGMIVQDENINKSLKVDSVKNEPSDEVTVIDGGGASTTSEEPKNVTATYQTEIPASDNQEEILENRNSSSEPRIVSQKSEKPNDSNLKIKTELHPVHEISDSDSDDDFIDVEDAVIEEEPDIVGEEICQADSPSSKEKVTERFEEEEIDEAMRAATSGFTDVELSQIRENPQTWLERMEEEDVALHREKVRSEAASSGMHEEIYREAQDLLRIFGIPWLASPSEAEAQCATLENLGLVDGSITEDSDIWVFGGKRVVKNLFKQNLTPEEYRYDRFESALGLHRDRLINLALLCGSDYTTGIEGIGPVGALEILSEFHGDGLQPLVEFRNWWLEAKANPDRSKAHPIRKKLVRLDLPSDFPNDVVRRAYLQPNVDESKEKFSWSSPDLDLLREFVKEKLGWSQQKVDNFMTPVLRRMREKQQQMKLTSFSFVVSPNKMASGSPTKNPSKRLQRAVNRLRNGETQEVDKSDERINQPTKRKQKATKGTKEKLSRVESDPIHVPSTTLRNAKPKRRAGKGKKGGSYSTDDKVVERVNLSEESEPEIVSDDDVDDFIRNVDTEIYDW